MDLPVHNSRANFQPKPCSIPDCTFLEYYGKGGLCIRHYERKVRLGDPLAPISKHAEKANNAERQLETIFRAHGHITQRRHRMGDGDLLIDNRILIEVKSAEMQDNDGMPKWSFNIHRHGKLNEVSHYYIFQFLGVPGQKGALYAAFKAPLGVLTMHFSLRKMIRELAPAVKLYEELTGASS